MKIQTQGLIILTMVGSLTVLDLFLLVIADNFSNIATAVNQAGLVRGGTQRLVKLKLAGGENATIEALRLKTSQRIDGLLDGSKELNLAKINDANYQAAMNKVKREWQTISQLVAQPNPDTKELFAVSETFFKTTDEAVSVAESVAKQEEGKSKILGVLSLVFSGVIVITTYFIVKNIVTTLRKTSTELASSSSQIAASLAEQSKIISQQAVSVNQTTTTMEELGASSRQSAEQGIASSTNAQKSLELCKAGSESVQKTSQGISTVKDKVTSIADKIVQLSEQTAQISTVSDLVANIAKQTNILALNAAVEAVRAGEQGKGFAVVAQEVRKLADQSKVSAEKISNLIKEIQSSINATVMVTDEGTKTANESMRLAQETLQSFEGIVKAVETIAMNTQQIALSSKQQAVGVQQAVSAMNTINLGAKEATASVSQIESAIKQLSESAQLLKEQI